MEQPPLQPVLESDLLTLRPLADADWPALFAAASDPKIWAGHVNRNRYQETPFRAFFDSGIKSAAAFTVIDNHTGQVIGSSRYHNFDAARHEIEIGWTFLCCAYWGGRYNAALKRLMLAHAFTFVDTVVFWVARDNLRSQGAMRNIGGRLRQGEFSKMDRGEAVPYCVFEISKADFETGPLYASAG